MCDIDHQQAPTISPCCETVQLTEAVGMVLAHDITEIRKGEFKGRAFRKGHIITEEDIPHLRKLGKERLYVLTLRDDEMHEDDAAWALAGALSGKGVAIQGEPKEGRINIVAEIEGLLKIRTEELLRFNLLGHVMCATLHANTVVKRGQVVAGTRAVPLVIKRAIVDEAVKIAKTDGGIIEVRRVRQAKVGLVVTGSEIYKGRVEDAFAPIITRKVREFDCDIIGVSYAPDDDRLIEERLRELLDAGADLLITTGGMSVDPDDVTRFAIGRLGVIDCTYGSAVLPGSMVMVAYLEPDSRGQGSDGSRRTVISLGPSNPGTPEPFEAVPVDPIPNPRQLIPILGVPACSMHHATTVLDLILPRVLAGEHLGRRDLAELGHGGLCLNCRECRFPVCPFGK